jgi:hypothetical protein
MFQFLIGVAFGAAGYWAWQSFGRDLLGIGNDQDTTYGTFNSTSGTNASSGTGSYNSGSGSGTSTSPSTTPTGGSSATPS